MIGIKLKEIREINGMNKKEFAQYLGVKYTTYNGYETEAREPSSDFLILVSEKFDVSIDYLLGLKDEREILHSYQLRADEFNHIKKYRFIEEHSPEGAKTVTYILNREHTLAERIYELEKETNKNSYDSAFHNENAGQPTRTLNYYQRLASAGTGQIVFDDVPVDLIEIPDTPEYARVKYAIGVNGDSMEPLYYDGDILLVEPMQDVRVNDIGIFIVDGESLVKKRGKASLISLNQNKNYPDIPLNEETRCLGRVVDKITCPNNLYAALTEDDKAALEQGAALLRAQSFSFGEKMDQMDIEESPSSKNPTSSHPDMSAFTPEDLKALENGRIKMFKSGKKA